PPVRVTPEVEAMIVAGSRAPEERRGDLAAQLGANAVGVARLAAIVDRLGGPDALATVVDYGERRVRAPLPAVPRRRVPVETRPARGARARATSGDARATFDSPGTDAHRRGNGNAVEAVTVSAVAFALRYAPDPTIPANGGAMRPVRVIAPRGSVVAARPPV